MKFGKFLAFVAFIALCAAGYFVLFGKGSGGSNAVQSDQDAFFSDTPAKRGDDATYSEEIRRNTAITLETQRKQEAMQAALDKKIKDANAEAQKTIRDLNDKLSEVSAQLDSYKQAAAQKTDISAEAVQNALDEKLSSVTKNLEELKVSAEKVAEDNKNRIAELEAQIEAQKSAVSEELSKPSRPNPYGSSEDGLTRPYGTVFEANSSNNGNPVAKLLSTGRDAATKLTGTVPARDKNVPKNYMPQPGKGNTKEAWPTIFPVYTLPPNTIMSDAMLLTPLIGRIPNGKDNTVEDPYFFKVEIGTNNFAANGQRIPGVAKMIASGYATGVREQECARGYIDSMTFIFVDGRIVTTGKKSQSGDNHSSALGYLTDPSGTPCINGLYINNAGQYIKSRSMAAFTEAAAKGLQASETKVSTNENGRTQAILDGNVWNYMLGGGISGTAAEVSAYIKERTAGAFDVVYVKQGVSVQIMLNEMIPIDYDSNGRKVNYYSTPEQEAAVVHSVFD